MHKHNQCAPKGTAATFVWSTTADDQRIPNVDFTPPRTLTAFYDHQMAALSLVANFKHEYFQCFSH